MIPPVERARLMAMIAHDSIGQRHKYTGAPYWTHTEEVASIVSGVPDATEDMICAAHLHDVLEDVAPLNPQFSRHVIEAEFGTQVRLYVDALTDVFTKESYPHFNRERRKHFECHRLAHVCAEAQTIKLADIISNTRDIVANGGDFASVYLAEKRQLLPFLKGGDAKLWKRANAQVEAAYEAIATP